MEITNTEMAAAWEGEADHWVRAADRYDSAAAAVWQTFLDQGHVAATDRVLDLGCGTGQSSREEPASPSAHKTRQRHHADAPTGLSRRARQARTRTLLEDQPRPPRSH